MPTFDAAEIRAKMASAPMRTTRLRMSIPIVNRFVLMLDRNMIPPPILVATNVVVDGAYRYAAGYMCDRLPWTRPGAPPPHGTVRYAFSQVIFEELDYENMMITRGYELPN